MPFYDKDDKRIFFSHIPKAAGTSIEYLLREHFEESFYSEYITPSSLQHCWKGDSRLINELNRKPVTWSFCIMRDPVDRMVSEYAWQNVNLNDPNKDPSKFHEWVYEMIEIYKTNKYCYDNHIRPQIDFIHDGMKIFKFSEWDKIFGLIQNKTGIPGTKLERFDHKRYTKFEVYKETKEVIYGFYKEDYNKFLSL